MCSACQRSGTNPRQIRNQRGTALGSEVISNVSYYERWVVAFANILLQKQIPTPEDLALMLDEITVRNGPEAKM